MKKVLIKVTANDIAERGEQLRDCFQCPIHRAAGRAFERTYGKVPIFSVWYDEILILPTEYGSVKYRCAMPEKANNWQRAKSYELLKPIQFYLEFPDKLPVAPLL